MKDTSQTEKQLKAILLAITKILKVIECMFQVINVQYNVFNVLQTLK